MAVKNLLADTDYADARDKRFASSVMIGKVSKLECTEEHANARCILPDRIDHEGTPVITRPVPVLQISAGGKKQFAMPRVGQNVLLVKLPNSTSTYAAIGFFYTKNDPPPVTDPKLDYTEWEGGHKQTYNANTDDNGEAGDVFLTQDFKAGWNCTVKKDVNLKTTDDGNITIESNKDVNVKAPNGLINLEQKTINLKGDTITLEGNLVFKGNITHTGNMTTSQVHTDSLGHHTGGREADLQQRIANLEKRLTQLEQRLDAPVYETRE
jgi:phage baseplate assembly protein gpV